MPDFQWKWRNLAYSKYLYGTRHVTMGGETYCVWVRLFWRFWFKVRTQKHFGECWKAVSENGDANET